MKIRNERSCWCGGVNWKEKKTSLKKRIFFAFRPATWAHRLGLCTSLLVVSRSGHWLKFFCLKFFWLFWKSLICMGRANHWPLIEEDIVLFRSSQQLASPRLRPVKGFFDLTPRPSRTLNLDLYGVLTLQGQKTQALSCQVTIKPQLFAAFPSLHPFFYFAPFGLQKDAIRICKRARTGF